MFSLRFLNNVGRNFAFRTFSSEAKGEITALYNFHVEKGGKIVNFGGFLLPVQYSDLSIVNSHLYTRKNASIFDVSHMLQTEIRGKNSIEFFETACTADILGLQYNSATLTVFTNEKGGILDDLIVTKIADDYLYIVSNAAMKKQDQQIMLNTLNIYKQKNPNADIQIKFYEPNEKSLLALQGPKAADALKKLTDVDISKLYFMNTIIGTVADVRECRITRCGYTGEDGFEISIPAPETQKVVTALLNNENVKLAGLGARDSLRLEAGLCLYGNDINAETTPVEGALTWLVSKRRRELKNFPGANLILKQIKEGSTIKRIGLISQSGPPARQGAVILSKEGEELGKITSGCPSPSLGKNIAMGYVKTSSSKLGTSVNLKIRDKVYEAAVSKMPFVKSNYYIKPK
ncbi:unnamed protein product [Psylliodes chrysocephalus]|uniref:Aminomethyltransferase n=1 Tax=Psylliodes chrysocephalus TaxID=3402493 RepID=A0A9P0CNX5_9CUCU|nr:unnamed protein product [Psylliodes chrysocephala]